ncbi:MAG: ABC transporter permease subunit, partial [Lachnospiraceae bacterium]|nr:ABC transporter permease subunit [Lachnospiraceae bacterium]
MIAIYQKELKSYIKSLSGWLFLAALTFFAGLYFSLNNLLYGSPYISDTLANMLIVLLFLIPILTMRSFAEEKKFKTDQLLLTAPVRVSSIIFGKFFAMATIMAIATMIFSMGIILVAVYGSVPVAETVMALIAFFLYGCICIAIGMFLSSVTEHQFIAAILTYGFYIFMILVPSFCEVLLGADSWLVKALSILDVTTPFNMLFSGIIVPTDIVYIFSALF